MLRDEVLTILKQQDTDLSGEEISRRLGVTRMAVSNAVKALRREGYVIDSATNRGYRLRLFPRSAGFPPEICMHIFRIPDRHPFAALI